MIQRIQSLYLLVVVILMSLIVFLPYGYLLTANGEIIEFTALGAKVQTDSTTIVNYNAIPVLILAALSALTAFISIFLFKKRLLQIRLSGFNIVISLGCFAVMLLYLFMAGKSLEANVHFKIFIAFPIISAILLWLTMRAIGKDEALVRSIDRIR